MKKYMMLPLVALGVLSSCVDDKGSYDYTVTNTVTVDNFESTYYAIREITTLEIEPRIKGDIYGNDLSKYEFTWHVCQSSLGSDSHVHTVIGNEPKLVWPVDMPIGNYTLYFTIKDKETGLEQISSSTLRVTSPFARGFMLLGTNGDDDVALIDMLSMPSSGDTVMVENALKNDGMMRKPKEIYFTGTRTGRDNDYMWLFCEDHSWKLNSIHDDDYAEFDVLGNFASLDIADNDYGINEDEEECVGIYPHRSATGMCLSAVQGFLTKDCIYGPASVYGTPYFGVPCNRMANSTSSPLFKFYPKLFHNTNVYSMRVTSTPIYVYNTDDDVFVMISSGDYLNATHCTTFGSKFGDAFDLNCRNDDRTLVWGDNTSTPGSAHPHFVMKSVRQPGIWEIYCLKGTSVYIAPTKEKFTVDLSVARDFDKAEFYSFIGCRRAIFYSVGNILHQYDFQRNLHMEMDMEAPITMVKADYYSVGGRHDNLMVATWDQNAKQGMFMKLEIGSNPNFLSMEIRNDFDDMVEIEDPSKYTEKWPTRLKIVDAEWRAH